MGTVTRENQAFADDVSLVRSAEVRRVFRITVKILAEWIIAGVPRTKLEDSEKWFYDIAMITAWRESQIKEKLEIARLKERDILIARTNQTKLNVAHQAKLDRSEHLRKLSEVKKENAELKKYTEKKIEAKVAERLLEKDSKTSIHEWELRKLAAQTKHEETKAEKAAKSVVEVDYAAMQINRMIGVLRQGMRAIPDRVSPLLVGESDVDIIHHEILKEIDAQLLGLSTGLESVVASTHVDLTKDCHYGDRKEKYAMKKLVLNNER